MIDREQPNALRLFFVLQGSIIPKIYKKILVIVVLSAAVMAADKYAVKLPHMSMSAIGIFALALSLFLGFRNNAAYDRWWEGRRLWGSMIAEVRTLGRHARIFLGEEADREKILRAAVVFAHLHKANLRGGNATSEAELWMDKVEIDRFMSTRNPANAALNHIADKLGDAAANGRVNDFGLLQMTNCMGQLANAQAGCERIATTPLPFVYSLLVRRTTYLYCLLVPFALLDSAGWFTPLLAGIIAYVFFGLQAVTRELEHPFQNVINGLPLDTMCRTIEISVSEALGLIVPEPMRAKNNLLT